MTIRTPQSSVFTSWFRLPGKPQPNKPLRHPKQPPTHSVIQQIFESKTPFFQLLNPKIAYLFIKTVLFGSFKVIQDASRRQSKVKNLALPLQKPNKPTSTEKRPSQQKTQTRLMAKRDSTKAPPSTKSPLEAY